MFNSIARYMPGYDDDHGNDAWRHRDA